MMYNTLLLRNGKSNASMITAKHNQNSPCPSIVPRRDGCGATNSQNNLIVPLKSAWHYSTMDSIRKQVEFYFSDSNYRKDTFLRAAAESDPDGFVPISVLLTFNKLKQLTTDADKVVEALKESNILSMSNDLKKVKRLEPLPELDTSADRTLYVKGYPLDDEDVSIDTISNQFSEFGKVLYVRLRRDNDKKFKGSCFIEFSTETEMQAANTAANADGLMHLSYKGTPFLCVIPFKVWHSNKQAKFSKRKEDKHTTDDNVKRKLDEVTETPKLVFDEGLLVKLSNVPTTTSAIAMKEFLKEFVDVKFVDYNNGDSTAVVRLGDPESAKKLADLKPVFKVGEVDSVLQGVVVTGEEELAFWAKKNSESKSSGRSKGNHNRGRNNFKKQRR